MADTEAGEFLIEVGKELNRTPEQMQGIIQKVVVDNWYETIESLQEVSDVQWQTMQLPGRLIDIIKAKLALLAPQHQHLSIPPVHHPVAPSPSAMMDVDPSSSVPQPGAMASANALSPPAGLGLPLSMPSIPSVAATCGDSVSSVKEFNSNEDREMEGSDVERLTTVEFAPPEEVKFPLPILSATEKIKQEVPVDKMPGVLITLGRLLNGVLASPTNESKRKIRKENENFQAKVGQFAAGVAFLQSVGFQDVGEHLILPVAYLSRLTDAHGALTELGREAGVTVPPIPNPTPADKHIMFNPYQSSITSTTAEFSRVQGKLAEKRFHEVDQIRAELKQKKEDIRRGGEGDTVELRPVAFHLSRMGRLEDALSAVQQEREQEETNPGEAGVAQSDIAKIKESMGDGPQFKSRAKQELAKLSKQKVHRQCILRVLFPDKLVLQLHFRPVDTIAHVQQQIKQLLREECRDLPWYIYETPPMRKFTARRTLHDEGLVPGAMVHFAFVGAANGSAANIPQPPYLQASLLTHLTTQTQQTQQQATNAPSTSPSESAAAAAASAAASGAAEADRPVLNGTDKD
ncbi:unnamed protein product [Vitrella brassicaformis CCMP3155]|uniref:PUB domain-containing protein n=1 Tax=Vitrella brassicaformis (strain CCMP3155) TaxID=1169540 RepID=A0A0G4EPV5_VITBC|nr:unnamed protein product [Vitrella brassicaformis CCMP3155]|eukprot:CEL99305.1 unnamed protein product [Vitrella brassicaformis CCMP3155]